METVPDTREWREKRHNEKAKKMAKTITQNLYTYLCVAIPFILICTIWTDFTLPKMGWGLMGDGILTVVLMVVGERLMVKVGAYGGKLDDDCATAKKRYAEAKAEAKKRNTALMQPFCDWQIDCEYERVKRAHCARLRIKYDVYKSDYEGKTLDELKAMLPLEKAVHVDHINKLEPIELTPDMLLYNCSRSGDRRDIKISGEDYEDNKIYGKKGLAISIVTCIFCVGLPITLGGAVTLAKVIYTIGKLVVLLYRMFHGYSEGAKAYHTIEVRHLDSKSDYLEDFARFIDTQEYLKIANEYTQINKILGITPEENHETACIQPNQERAGDGDLGSQPHPLADAACAVA